MKKPANLLHVTTSLACGGAEQVLVNVVTVLATKGYRQSVIYFRPGIHVESLRALGIPCYHIKGLFWHYDPLFCIRLAWRIWCIKPDGIHSLLWMANLVCRPLAFLLRIPIVHGYHNMAGLDGAWRNLADKVTGAGLVSAIAASDIAARSLTVKGIRSGITVIYNGIDVPHIRAKADKEGYSRTYLGLTPDHFIVGTVGRLEPVKNQALLIKAFARVANAFPQARLVIIGNGSCTDELRKLAQELCLADVIIFCGEQPGYRYYRLFDCFVLPSVSEGGVSLALQEAMCLEVPCIVTQAANVNGIIQSGHNGLVVDLEVKDLAVAIMQYAQARAYAQKLAKIGAQTIENEYDMQVMATGYDACFQRLACNKTVKRIL